ncbi:M4 family metallopeptidase [Parabacteroides sp. PF5-9]|uniref:M4 family metallopeptidase n=1 Tax=Parabacteroides sp. PF5-9 TaxID=1742404 RepID=UPI0024771870|nr:M4 family metallopeptidase [Parabacteroides sp. PF5-9]MDH6358394.1 Zn-dependent metalloprotease [Parabacteroides sp. PF5-9]
MNTKAFFITLILSCIGIHSMAQQSKFLQKETDRNGNISFAVFSTDSFLQPINKSVELVKELYIARKTDELKQSEKRKEQQDELGYTHQYYQQYYKNVKVEYGEVSVHANRLGNIETIFGDFKPVGDIDTNPKLTEAQALNAALKYVGAEVYKWQIPEEEQWIKEYYNSTFYPAGELVIVKDQLLTDKIYRLAYRFDIYAHKPLSRDYIWVDAITGDILHMDARIHFANATGTAATRYSGSRSITTDSYNGRYRLRETRNGVNISTFNMNHAGTYSSTDFTDNDNNWTTAEHSVNNNNAGLDAHWGAEMVYEYFKQVHARNSWNNSNGPLLSYVNADLKLINKDFTYNDNAFWDGSRMTYGKGSSRPPFTTLDICAHEIAHGICSSSAKLVYQKESGAINESLSDIWAACVENWATTDKQPWLIGEDLGYTMRSMSYPNTYSHPDTYGGTYWYNINSCTPTFENDYCGVHRNSGVMNYWFYLLSVGGNGTNDFGKAFGITGIGIEKAAKIVYRAETVYMTQNTTFANARTHTITAATNLYGATSKEVIAVTNAWHAVGVGDSYPLTIVGPSMIGGTTSSSYTINYVPANATLSWSYNTNLLTLVSYSANGIVVKPKTSTTVGDATITAKLTYSGSTKTVSHYVGVGGPHSMNVQLIVRKSSDGSQVYPSGGLCPNTYYYATLNPGNTTLTNVNWGASSQLQVSSASNTQLYFRTLSQGWGTLNITATTSYGVTKTILGVTLTESSSCGSSKSNSYFSISSIPSSNIVEIKFDMDLFNAQINKMVYTQKPSFDIRMYTITGVMVKQANSTGESVQFDVSALQKGTYIIHIYDGISEIPEIHKIQITH